MNRDDKKHPGLSDSPRGLRSIRCNTGSSKFATAAIISAITFFTFLPALKNGFVLWDDDINVYENIHIRSLDSDLLKWTFSGILTGESDYFRPLSFFSHAIDYRIFGPDPWGHHLTSVIIHSINTLLVFMLAASLIDYKAPTLESTGRRSLIAAAITSLLFGIHPLHVESVAWISERKDVLYAFFFLLSLLSYVKFTSSETSKKLFFCMSLLFFSLSALSKPMAVSLPFVLLILDYYPLGRLSKEGNRRRTALLLEKLPFFFLTLIVSVITIFAQYRRDDLASFAEISIMDRIFVAAGSVLFYLGKMIFPVDLAPYYPYPTGSVVPSLQYAGSFVLVVAITALAIFTRNKYKVLFCAYIYYLVALLPVSGLLQSGGQAAADRYTYLSSFGPFLLVGLGGAAVLEPRIKSFLRHAFLLLFLVAAGLLINKSMKQIGIWCDSITLWSHEIGLYPEASFLPYLNRGAAFYELRQYKKAIADYEKAMRLAPYHIKLYFDLGNAYESLGRYEEALEIYNQAAVLQPSNARAYFKRAFALYLTGDYEGAIKDYSRAIGIDPQYVKAYLNRGTAYYKMTHYRKAMKDFESAVKADPSYIQAYVNLGLVYSKLGNSEQAMICYRKAEALKTQAVR